MTDHEWYLPPKTMTDRGQGGLREATRCPSCGGDAHLRGVIRPHAEFAGNPLDVRADAGLYRCPDCALQFRWPQLDASMLHRLYERGSEAMWGTEAPKRSDWTIVRGILATAALPGRSVLDVGCFDGRFLQTLDSSWRKSGVELNRVAADRAAAAEVEIVARRAEDLAALGRQYACVVAFDVIEHVVDPREFLRTLVAVTKPGGEILLATGTTDAPSWRLMGSRYWYCSLNEHISFINRAWCAKAVSALALELVEVVPFSHATERTLGRRLREAAANVIYRIAPGAISWARRRKGLSESGVHDLPPLWMTARDHILVRLRVPVSQGKSAL